jgi:protein-tyrosine phosphatase
VRPVLAHAERCPELLHDPPAVEKLIRAGCLIQVSSMGITHATDAADKRALKDWFRRGIAHVLGSDGHSLRRRPPDLADAYVQVKRWAGAMVADTVGRANGLAVLHGRTLVVPPIEPPVRHWLPRLW